MKRKRIDKALEIIKYAIQNKMTVTDASTACGHAYTYVKNVKSDILKAKIRGKVDEDLYNEFMEEYKKYEYGNKKNVASKPASVKNDIPPGLSSNPVNNRLQQTTKGDSSEILFTAHSEHTEDAFNDDPLSQEPDIEEVWEREDRDREHQENQSYARGHIKTIDELLDVCDVDQSIWQVKDYLVNKWDVTSWKRGYAQTVENFQVKARLERAPELHKAQMAAEIFQKMTRNYTPPQLGDLPPARVVEEIRGLEKENNLLEISIFDLHLGKLGWAGETGENFDTKIAAKRFMYSIKTLLHRAQGFNISKILFLVGQDFFNSDNKENTTSNGTPQDEDLRWQKTFDVGCRLLVDGVNLLKQYGVSVEVLVVPGNHDFERSFYVGKFLEGWFNNDQQVRINNGASPRKYYVHGEVLLGFTHGKDEKQDSLPMLMSVDKESKPHWSKTTYHEWHLGHVHRQKTTKYTILDKNKIVDEDLGVTVRYLSSLTGTEEWHHKKGFVGQIKSADAFVWNDKTGMVAHLRSNLLEQ